MVARERELETYKKRLPELLRDEGKFVVIRGEEIIGVWPGYEEALAEGYQRFGLTPFMVKRIEWAETVQTITRDVPLCQP